MTLALPIAALLALALFVGAWAVRGGARWRWLQTLLVALAPLAAFLYLVRRAPDRAPARALRVAGQYAPLPDTVVVGDGAADVRVAAPDVGAPGGAGLRLRLWYDHETHAMEFRLDSGAAPVFVDGEPVNALPLEHGTRVTLATRPGLEVVASLPRWPLACLLRSASLCGDRALTVRDGSGAEHRFLVRVGSAGVAASALPDRRLLRAPFTLVSGARGGVFVAASPGGPVRVDGRAPPAAAAAPTVGRPARDEWPELRVGAGSGATTMRVQPDTLGNRLDLRLVGRSMGERWAVPSARARATMRVVAGVDPGPGTLRLLDLGDAAPLGARARPYAGALEWTGTELRWHADGRTRVLAPGAVERLPGTGAAASERGHLVTVTSSGPAREAVVAVAGVWIAGALLLAFGALGEGAPASGLRVLVVGLVYVLAFVRLTIAYRVSSAEPYNAEALPWAALFLAAFPALVVLLERWPFARLAAGEPRRERRAKPRAASSAGGAPAGAAWARGLAAVRAAGSGARPADDARAGWALLVPVAAAGALGAGAGRLGLQ
jgi:hypothetical protein